MALRETLLEEVFLICKGTPDIVEILAVVCEKTSSRRRSVVVVVSEVEEIALAGLALSFKSEALQSSLFGCHGRVVFAEATVDYGACTIPVEPLGKECLLAL